jgi:hypothetical protein
MNQLSKLQNHYVMLKVEERLLLDECDWDGLNSIRMALDDTQDQITALTCAPTIYVTKK